MATAGVTIPLATYLPGFYAQNLGLGLTAAGWIFTVSRLWSAFTDPVIGYWSDRTRTRYGRRKPWIACGAALFVAGIFAVFHPPAAAGTAYLAVALLTLCLGWTMTATPLYAWGGELSSAYHERSRVQTYLQSAASVGIFLVLAGPAAMDRLGGFSTSDKIGAMGIFLIATIGVGLPILLLLFAESPSLPTSPAPSQSPSPSPSPLASRSPSPLASPLPPPGETSASALPRPWRTLLEEGLLWRVIASDFSVSLGQGFRGAVLFFFMAAVMHMPRIGSLVLLLQYAFGIAASPVWLRISYRLGKHRTLVVAECCQVAVNLLLLTLSPGALPALLALTIAQGLTQGSGNLMLKAIVSDVADLHRSKTGRRVTGLFFSIFNVTANAGLALAVGVAFLILDLCGFVPGRQNTPQALRALQLFFALAPAAGHALSAAIMWHFPLDESRHAQVLRELRQRQDPAA